MIPPRIKVSSSIEKIEPLPEGFRNNILNDFFDLEIVSKVSFWRISLELFPKLSMIGCFSALLVFIFKNACGDSFFAAHEPVLLAKMGLKCYQEYWHTMQIVDGKRLSSSGRLIRDRLWMKASESHNLLKCMAGCSKDWKNTSFWCQIRSFRKESKYYLGILLIGDTDSWKIS